MPVVRPSSAAAGLLLGGVLSLASASPALAVCDAYSGNCSPAPSVAPSEATKVLPTSNDRPAVSGESASLPFTGGELVLLTALGAGALAGGTALVVAGRRKPGTAD